MGWTPLRYAIEKNDDEAAEIIMKLERRDLVFEVYDYPKSSHGPRGDDTYYTVLHLLADRHKTKLVESFYANCRAQTKDDTLRLHRFQQAPVQRTAGKRTTPDLPSDDRLLSCLHLAVVENNAPMAVLFIKNGIDADLTYGGDYCSSSPIALAVELDYLELFRKLIFVSRMMGGERRREFLAKFLVVASETGSKNIVEELLHLIDEENFLETEMCQCAVEASCVNALRRGHAAISDILTKAMRGQNLNEALREAVKKGMTDIVQRLIVKGADVNDTGGDLDAMPLMLCVKHEQLDVLPILMVNSSVIPENFWSQVAAASDDFSRNAFEVYRQMRFCGSKPDALEFTDRTINPMHIAAAMDKVDVLYQFLDLGARHDLVDEQGNSILHWAAKNDGVGVIKDFSDYFSPNLKNKDGDTPLHVACKNGRPKAAQILLQAKGVDLKVRNLIGDTCLHSAVRKLLETKQAKALMNSPVKAKTAPNGVKLIVNEPTREDKVETVNVVARSFRSQSLLNEKDINGNNAISILVQAAREKEIQLLAGSLPSIPNKEGKCALDYAMLAYSTKPALITAMLQTFGSSAAVYLATRYREGKMPLHVFAEHGEVDKVKLMVQHGASVTDFNGDGNTVMHLLADLAASDSKNIDLYLSMGRTIIQTLVNFRIRRQIQLYEFVRDSMHHIFAKIDEYYRQPLIAQRIADEDLEILVMIYLTRKLKNRDGLSVTNYAASIKSLPFLTYLLDVKKIELQQTNQNGDVKHVDEVTPLAYENGDYETDESSSFNGSGEELQMASYNVNYLSPESLRGLSVADCDWIHEVIQETLIVFLYPIIGKIAPEKFETDKEIMLAFMHEMKSWSILERFESLRENEERRSLITRRNTTWKNSESEDTSPTKKNEKKKKESKLRKKSIKLQSKPQSTDATTLEMSLLETIIDMKDEIAAAEIIDIMPLTKLVESYWAAYRWIYFLIMLVHIFYMSAFSAYTISDESCSSLRKKNRTHVLELADLNGSGGYSIIHPYMIFLFYPFIFLGVTIYFETVQFIAQYRRWRVRNRRSQALSTERIMDVLANVMDLPFNMVTFILSYFPTIGCIVYTTCMILWYYEFTHCEDMEPYYHSACIIVGWLLTITYSKGFESLHSLTNVMESIVLTDILRFFMVYIFVCVGFSFGFHVLLLYAVPPDEKPPDSALTTLFENLRLFMNPSEIFKDGQFEMFKVGFPLLYVRVAYLFYSFFSGLILINILIAMMNDSYTRVSATERITWRVTSLRQAMYVFRAFPFMTWIVSKTLKNEGQILSSSPAYRPEMTIYHIHCELPPPTEPVKTEMGELEVISKEVKSVEARLHDLAAKVDVVLEAREDYNILMNTTMAKIDELANLFRMSQNKPIEAQPAAS